MTVTMCTQVNGRLFLLLIGKEPALTINMT
jgi:hypothetical protein